MKNLFDPSLTAPQAVAHCSAGFENPHSFFGRLTPEEWAVLMYKHVDHHLRQFGA